MCDKVPQRMIAAIDPLPIKFIFRDPAFKDDIALKMKHLED